MAGSLTRNPAYTSGLRSIWGGGVPNVHRFLAVLAFTVVSHGAVGQVSMSIQTNKPEVPVIRLPFSADQKVSTVRHLADGALLKSEVQGHVYRSAAGIERYDGVMPATPDHPDPTTMVYIIDRTKHSAVLLNLRSKTATVEHLPADATVIVKFLPLQQPRGQGQLVKPGDLVTKDLGKRTQGLITLVGKRVTGTIAAGSVGNDQPLSVITEVWVYPELKLEVNEIEHNPFSGERTFELSNIRGEEPDPALFEIPQSYAVKERAALPSSLPDLKPSPEQTEKQIPIALSSTDPSFKNSVAYALANENSHLTDAQTLAVDAVKSVEQETAAVALKGNKDDDYKQSVILTSYWDTLGWVYYRQGNQEKAEAYILAAWKLKPNPEYALHLGSIYEAQLRPKDAVTIYRMALSAKNSPIWQDDFQTRLDKLGEAHAEPIPMEVTTSLPSSVLPIAAGATETVVEILIAAAGPVVVAYPNGEPAHAESLTHAIQDADARFLPDNGPETILRRARITCAAEQASHCVLHFLTPGVTRPSMPPP
jgi:hypothetical protein